jgi:ABC-type cobalamin/Fe3+-siderophores transport system ATPase subunit
MFDSSDAEDGIEPEHTTCLVLGRSGTGKSTLVKSILAEFSEFGKPIYILNDHSRKSKYIHINWNQVKELNHCSLVIEDIIQATPAQFRILCEILSVKVHHDRLSPTIAISHALMRQNLYGLLSYFTRIYITGYRANLRSFTKVLQYFGFQDDAVREHVRNFLACTEPFTHFLVNVERFTVEKVKFPFTPESEESADHLKRIKKNKNGSKRSTMTARDSIAMAKADRYLSVLKNHKEAKAIFELLWCKLNKKLIDPNTLEITLPQKSGGKLVISLIEYIASLTQDEEDKDVPASKETLKFHKYCRSVHSIRLPNHYVLNRAFW